LSRRMVGMIELLMGRARLFPQDRLGAVVSRVLELEPDHILITGDITTTALPSEFREAKRMLAPLLADPDRVSMVPGNHDRTSRRSYWTRRFESVFGAYMPSLTFPWLRQLDSETAILGLDPTRPWFSAYGLLPEEQLRAARAITSDPDQRPRRLIVACHYPVAAPVHYQRELFNKRLRNDAAVRAWLAGIGPHLYCCGHVHAAWAFQPPSLPEQICLNSGAPLMLDPKGLRLPGFLEIILDGPTVTVNHQAWMGTSWQSISMLKNISLATVADRTCETV
jgi:Icc-related predicted phosphoesterase